MRVDVLDNVLRHTQAATDLIKREGDFRGREANGVPGGGLFHDWP